MKVDFTNIEIVDLPCFPFREDEMLELKLIDYISHSIIKIDKAQRRLVSKANPSKIFNFSQSNTLIAIDISPIESRESSYLESLTDVIYLHPFICINNSIPENRLQKLRIHQTLLKKGFILPILPFLNPIDITDSGCRYGENVLSLIDGEINSLEKKSQNLSPLFLKNIQNRFPYIIEDGLTIKYHVKIIWLGVEDKNIINFLNYMFNSNEICFDITKTCKDFGIHNIELFKLYINKSFLFDLVDNDKAQFRFIRHNIILKTKSKIMTQFEEKMYQHSVIDTTETNYNEFKGNFLEFHDLGKMFKKEETYSLKLIGNIRRKFADVNFNKIILIDNGYEYDLKIMLEEFFAVPVCRVINNQGKPQIYPFDNLSFNENLLIVIDLCNRGKFLKSVITLLQSSYEANIFGAYCFILGHEFDHQNIISTVVYDDFKFHYFADKRLHDVSNIIIERQKSRRQSLSDERFLFFWDTINKLATVKRNLFFSESKQHEHDSRLSNFSSCYLQKFEINDGSDHTLKNNSDFTHYINDLISKHDFTGCIVDKSHSSEKFKNILHLINNNIEIVVFDFSSSNDDDVINFYNKQKSVLIYNDGFNIGQIVLQLLERIGYNKIISNNNVSLLSLISRQNMRNSNSHIEIEHGDKLRKALNDRHYIYYMSNLPFYLLNMEDEQDRRFRDRLASLSSVGE